MSFPSLKAQQPPLTDAWSLRQLQLASALGVRLPSVFRVDWSDSWLSTSVVLKLFQDEAHLCKVNYFVAPQKKTHDENILLQ